MSFLRKIVCYIMLFIVSISVFGCLDKPNDPPPDTKPNYDDPMYDGFDGSLCTFYDKFEGDSLDLDKWSYLNGTGAAQGIKGWGNQERQYYQPQNATVANGVLTITAKVEQKDEDDYPTDYTSTQIITQGKFFQKYGVFEARIRLTKELQGLWPAFWMKPEEMVYGGWPRSGEIDIVEMKGRYPLQMSSAIHFSKSKDDNGKSNKYFHGDFYFPNGGRITDFHLYSVNWTPDSISFSVDGVTYHTIEKSQWRTTFYENEPDGAPFDRPFYMILNLAVGGKFDGGLTPPDEDMPAALEIDFVRVYAYGN